MRLTDEAEYKKAQCKIVERLRSYNIHYNLDRISHEILTLDLDAQLAKQVDWEKVRGVIAKEIRSGIACWTQTGKSAAEVADMYADSILALIKPMVEGEN